MPNKKLQCKRCKDYFPREQMVQTPFGRYCGPLHASEQAVELTTARQAKQRKKAKQAQVRDKKTAQREFNAETKRLRKSIRTRTQWYKILQDLTNQYVTKVRDVGNPCCTCGTTNPNIKYDAGHCFTTAAREDIRFELTNIHIQCSVQCNQHASGVQGEHKKFIVDKYGQDHLDWLTLETNHPMLKDKFPHWEDIEKEIKRWRAILREHKLTPCR